MSRDAADRRILAICVPGLPLQRLERTRGRAASGDGGDRIGPLAIADAGRIRHGNAASRAAGVRVGDSVGEARAACAALEIAPNDPAADRAALEALAEAMLAIAPSVEIAPPDALLLDAGAAHLAAADPAAGEEALADRARALAAALGYAGRVAVASGRGPARALAHYGTAASRRVAPGEAAAALAPLPLAALEPPPHMEQRLLALGVRDVGALARLPPAALAHRFGAAGTAAARLARGEDPTPLAPFAPSSLPEEHLDLEAPVERAEPLLFVLSRLADRVAARLVGRGLGATRLELRLRLDAPGERGPPVHERIAVRLARPSASASAWLLVLRERVGTLSLSAPVVAVALAAVEAAPALPEQLALDDRPKATAALETVVARLAARRGDGALFSAEPLDRHRPEAAYRAGAFAPAKPQSPVAAPPDLARPTRLLSRPRPVVAEGEGGRVTALRLDGRAYAVLALAGPERLRGEWWNEPFDRDYYRARLDDLGDCWIYRDGADGRLWLHGFFD